MRKVVTFLDALVCFAILGAVLALQEWVAALGWLAACAFAAERVLLPASREEGGKDREGRVVDEHGRHLFSEREAKIFARWLDHQADRATRRIDLFDKILPAERAKEARQRQVYYFATCLSLMRQLQPDWGESHIDHPPLQMTPRRISGSQTHSHRKEGECT